MGIRFRKSVKIAPGVKLNLNKKSVGLTVGNKGAHVTVNSKGTRTTSVGIPGTGLSYVDVKTAKSKKGSQAGNSSAAASQSKDFTKASNVERLKARYSNKALKRFSIIFYILGTLLAIVSLLLTIAVPLVGIIFLLFAAFIFFMGRHYSKMASADREEFRV